MKRINYDNITDNIHSVNERTYKALRGLTGKRLDGEYEKKGDALMTI